MSKWKEWWTLNPEEESQSADSVTAPLAPHQRRSTAPLVALSFGYAFTLTGMIAGGQIAPAASINNLVTSMILGNLALFVICFLVAFVAFKTGCSTPLVYQLVFGRKGMFIPATLIVFVGLGWQASMVGMFPDTWVGSEVTPLYIGIGLFAGLLYAYTCYVGIKALEIVSWPASIFLIIIGVMAIVKSYMHLGGIGGIDAATRDLATTNSLSISDSVNIIIGSWIVGAVIIGDFTRFCKKPIAVFLFVATSFLLVQPFLNSLGILGVLAFGNFNPAGYMGAAGSVMWVFIAIGMSVALWTTGDKNLYFTQTSMSNLFKLPKRVSVVILGTIGAVAGAVGAFNYVDSFIVLLAGLIPPIIGPVIVDFYILHKRKYDVKLLDKMPAVNVPAICAYIVGVLVPFLYTPSIIPAAVWGIVLSVFMYSAMAVVYKMIGKKFGYMVVSELATDDPLSFNQNTEHGLVEVK